MNKKIALILIGPAIGCVLAVMLFKQPPAVPSPVLQRAMATAVLAPVVDEPVSMVVGASATNDVQIDAQPKTQKQNAGNPVAAKDPIQDPTARIALSLVGADPDAETYWLGAIINPNLPQQEREDLMEDLNEEGLSDPKHPSAEDMTLIANRIELIEEIAPYADDFMLEHLGEARKDLGNLLAGNPAN